MPASFVMEALKAQAVAARSYALAYTNNGSGSICTTQSCQVFKPEPKGGAWEEAVNSTRGWVMVQGGSPVKAWYSSTHGGYVLSTSELPGWSATSWTKHATDTTSGSAGGFSELASNAYDKESPWFCCDWGARGGRKTAWLRSSEVADIVNATLLSRACSYDDVVNIYTKPTNQILREQTHGMRREFGKTSKSRHYTFANVSNITVSADFSGW